MTFQGYSPASSAPPLLLRGGTILTLDAEATVLEGDVLVEAGRIRAIGRIPELPPAARVLDVSGCFVLPGLVQGHLHLGQTFFRGLAENRRLLAGIAASGLRAFAGLCLMDSGEGLPSVMRQETDNALAETEALGDRYDG